MNGDKAFIDTNIFVYAKLKDDKEEKKRERAVRFLGNSEDVSDKSDMSDVRITGACQLAIRAFRGLA
jgi:predicted nucleic acid-binding protein